MNLEDGSHLKSSSSFENSLNKDTWTFINSAEIAQWLNCTTFVPTC